MLPPQAIPGYNTCLEGNFFIASNYGKKLKGIRQSSDLLGGMDQSVEYV